LTIQNYRFDKKHYSTTGSGINLASSFFIPQYIFVQSICGVDSFSIAQITEKKHFGNKGIGTKNPIFFIPIPLFVSSCGYRSHLRSESMENPSPIKEKVFASHKQRLSGKILVLFSLAAK
jgi:hypothetical protein